MGWPFGDTQIHDLDVSECTTVMKSSMLKISDRSIKGSKWLFIWLGEKNFYIEGLDLIGKMTYSSHY